VKLVSSKDELNLTRNFTKVLINKKAIRYTEPYQKICETTNQRKSYKIFWRVLGAFEFWKKILSADIYILKPPQISLIDIESYIFLCSK